MRSYPHSDPTKKVVTRLGGSEPARFLITEDEAKVWGPVSLPESNKITIEPTSARKRRDWLVDILIAPSRGPFLAASIGMSSADLAYWRMTMSDSMIVFGGSATLLDGSNIASVDRRRFLEAVAWFKETAAPVSDLLRMRETTARFRRGTLTGEATRAALGRIKTDSSVLKSYPGVDDPFQIKLASYAANEWEPR